MRTLRRAAGIVPLSALLLVLPAAGLAQDPVVTYTDGAAQVLVRGASPSLTTFALTSGVRDATAGTLTLAYAQTDGAATLEILTPNVAGTHAAPPTAPRAAAVTWSGINGQSGARSACTVTWSELSATSASGTLLCPKERQSTGKKARYSVVGTFAARVAPVDGAPEDPAAMPIYAAGVPVTVAGQTVAAAAAVDLASVCVLGSAKGADHGDCTRKQLPVDGTFRAVVLNVCVADDGEAIRLIDKTGTSRILFGGSAAATLAIGLPAVVTDPAVTTKGFPRVVNPGTCLDGHLVAGTQGPLVVWTPPNGAPPVAWTLDETALAHTADAPGPVASGDPGAGSPAPAQTITYTTGFADTLVDGATSGSADDLELTEGTYLSDGNGATVLHLAFESAAASVVIDLPGTAGSYAWDAGAATANEGVAITLGDLTQDAGLSGCQVDVAATEAGGVQGSYVCLPPQGGSASGSFVANP